MITYNACVEIADHFSNRLLLHFCNFDLLLNSIDATKLVVDNLNLILEELHLLGHFVSLSV